MKVPFIGPSFAGFSPHFAAEVCQNLYVDIDPAVDPNAPFGYAKALFNTPGMVKFATPLANVPVRGLKAANGALFSVNGSSLYSTSSAGVSTLLGQISTSTGPVSMSDNALQLTVVDGTNQGHVYTYSTGIFQAISGAMFASNGSAWTDFYDQYTIQVRPNSREFFLSNLADSTTYQGVAFASKEGAPDNIVSTCVNQEYLWIFGARTTEIWFDAGTYPFAFQRIQGIFVEHGCASAASVAKADNSVFWLTDRGSVVRSNGFTPVTVSDPAIDYQISQYTNIADAFAFTYQQNGHWFYVLTFPEGHTWVYDITTRQWHQRKSHGIKRWRANCYAHFGTMHIVGDVSNGSLYQLDPNTFTEDGQPVERIRITSSMSNEQKYIFAKMLRLDFEFGDGIVPLQIDPTTGLERVPQIMLSWSDDNGQKWSNERWQGMGARGQRDIKVYWHMLGRFRQRLWKIKVSDPVKFALVGAYLEVRGGTD